MRRMLALSLFLIAIGASTASAQVVPGYGPPYVFGPSYGPTSASERQRYEMEQVRVRGAEAESLAQRQSLESRLTLLQLQQYQRSEADRAATATMLSAPLSLERERQAREAATARRQSTVAGVTQIDDWLYRPHP